MAIPGPALGESTPVIGALLFQLAVALAPIVLIVYVVLAWYCFLRRQWPAAGPARTALTAALIAFPAALLWVVWRILKDRSSTAAVALFYAPTLAAFVALAIFLVAWAIGVGGKAHRGRGAARRNF